MWKLVGLAGTLDESGEGYEPSPFSKMLAVSSMSDYKVEDFGAKYKGDKKVLVVCTEIKYMVMENGKKLSSGNHPVELNQPVLHLTNAGFDFDVATPTGKPAMIEEWALPLKDKTILDAYNNVFKPKLDAPLSLADIVAGKEALESYVLVFLPGGQGAMLGLPEDKSLEKLILHFKDEDKHVMSVCHGPASFLAAKTDPHPFAGYKIAFFLIPATRYLHRLATCQESRPGTMVKSSLKRESKSSTRIRMTTCRKIENSSPVPLPKRVNVSV